MSNGIGSKNILSFQIRMADPIKILEIIVWILKSGAPWRYLPSRYGDWNAVYKCFAKWQEEGIFEKIFQDLAIEADFQDISIDSTSVKVHKDGTGAKKGAMNV